MRKPKGILSFCFRKCKLFCDWLKVKFDNPAALTSNAASLPINTNENTVIVKFVTVNISFLIMKYIPALQTRSDQSQLRKTDANLELECNI